MDTALLADKDCRICGGKGRVKIGEGINDWAICPCVTLAHRKQVAHKILENSLPPRALEMTLKTFNTGGRAKNERALLAARNFVENFETASKEGWVIGFYGEPRCGKTHLAIAIGQACAKRYLVQPEFLNLPRALRLERERFRDESIRSPFDAAASAPLLLLDDLGAQYERGGSDRVSWVSEQLYNLIDARVMSALPIVYTTNLKPSELERTMGGESSRRVLGRLNESTVAQIELVAVPEIRSSKNSERADLLFAE